MTLCGCGCGQPTHIARKSDHRTGAIKGQPVRFLRGHSTRLRGHRPLPRERRCNGCGETKPLTTEFFPFDRSNRSGFAYRCCPCKAAGNQRWRGANRAWLQAYHAAYHRRNSEKKRRAAAAWRATHKARFDAAWRRWYAEHPGMRPSQRVWRTIHAAEVRLMNIRAHHRRRALEANASGRCTQEQFDARLAYYGWRCWLCRTPWTQIDHVKPITKGGSNWPSNLRPICSRCNRKKGNRWPIKSSR